jgi:DNA-binding CsgD family transcriptional regulator
LWAASKVCRGLLTGDRVLLAEAARFSAAAGRPFEHARAEELAGVAAADAGLREEAHRRLGAAVERYEQLQASWDVARVEARLRQAGICRGRRGTRRRPKSGWDSLTATERQVVGLVAEGLSNPEIGERMFLSRRTIQTHVSHALAKVQLGSRVELAAAVASHASGRPAREGTSVPAMTLTRGREVPPHGGRLQRAVGPAWLQPDPTAGRSSGVTAPH